MATIKRFEALIMWQRARELTRGIYKMLKNCKDRGFKDQIQRVSVSILSNIAEGLESGTKVSFLHYLYITKGLAGEVRAQLYTAFGVGYIDNTEFNNLKGKAEECSRLLSSFILKTKKGADAGLQRKYERPEDPHDKFMKDLGYEVKPDGRGWEDRKQSSLSIQTFKNLNIGKQFVI